MIRVIVMYNLPDGADETDFLDWRLGAHQRHNTALPDVLRTDFARITGAWPSSVVPRFRFITTVEWPDLASFERAFYAADVQAGLLENIKKLGEYDYSISEIITSSNDVGGLGS